MCGHTQTQDSQVLEMKYTFEVSTIEINSLINKRLLTYKQKIKIVQAKPIKGLSSASSVPVHGSKENNIYIELKSLPR